MQVADTSEAKRKYLRSSGDSNIDVDDKSVIQLECDSGTVVDTSGASTSRIDSDPNDSAMYIDSVAKKPTKSSVAPSSQTDQQARVADTTMCEKPKKACRKSSELIERLIQDPGLVIKFLSNPNLVAKIFQDKNLIMKIMTDPSTVTRLTSDPQVSEFLEENGALDGPSDSSDYQSEVVNTDELGNNDISDNMMRNMLDTEHSSVENPILTNLITPSKAESYVEKIEESSQSGDWDAINVNDVTCDVLQDVERIPIVENSIESILCEAIKLEFSAYSSLGGNPNSRELNDAERAKLNELIVANKALLAPLDDDITNLVGEECRFKVSALNRSCVFENEIIMNIFHEDSSVVGLIEANNCV